MGLRHEEKPVWAKLNAIFSSDIGHWDVVDMRDVIAEAYELVEHGLLNENEFRDFAFANVARMWCSRTRISSKVRSSKEKWRNSSGVTARAEDGLESAAALARSNSENLF
jgi:hypothetical protein